MSPSAADWSLRGRWGAEVDAIGEEFGAGLVTEADPSEDPIDDIAEELRFREESTRVSGVVRWILTDLSHPLFRLAGRVKTSSQRSQGELSLDLKRDTHVGTLQWTDVLRAQGGKDDPGGGVVNAAALTWRSPREWMSDRLRLSLLHEISRAGDDSLANVLDYTVLRPSLRWSRRYVPVRTTVEVGSRYKRSDAEANRDHDGVFADVRAESGWGGRWQTSLDARVETRSYAMADSVTPSYQENSLTSATTWRVRPRQVLRATFALQSTEYAIDSDFLRDHTKTEFDLGFTWKLRGDSNLGSMSAIQEAALIAAALEASDSRLESGTNGEIDSDSDSDLARLDELLADLDEIVAPSESAERMTIRPKAKWNCRFLLGGTSRHNQVGSAGEFKEAHLGTSLSRESLGTGWWDVELETGIRNYAQSSNAEGVIFEGLSFSLTSTDYRFVRTSLIAKTPLWSKFEFDVFAQFEREWHEERANDLHLWIVTASFTRQF